MEWAPIIIRSTGINQDGSLSGITEPSKKAQSNLIIETYKRAGLDNTLTGYFEAHGLNLLPQLCKETNLNLTGTGTPLGDPIEARAIGESFRRKRHHRTPLYIGALKSNVGHLEGTAEIAGVIKTVLVLEKGVIPPIANLEKLNPRIDADFFNIKFPTEAVQWRSEGLRRASVNSFGMGGTNCHVILDEAQHYLVKRHMMIGQNNRDVSLTPDSNVDIQPTQANGNFPHILLPKLLMLSAADEKGNVTNLECLAITEYRCSPDELEKAPDSTKIYLPEFGQPITTALQIALVDLLKSCNVVPNVVVGHSSGEIASAQYRMASIGLSKEDLNIHLEKLGSQSGFYLDLVTISCINSHCNVTISGPEIQVDEVITYCEKEKIFARKLKIGVGYHSPQMQLISTDYCSNLQGLEADAKGGKIHPLMVSSITSEIVSQHELRQADYWVQNMLSPVDFLGAFSRCSKQSSKSIVHKMNREHTKMVSIDFWLEIGPHSTLQGPIRNILASFERTNQVDYSSTLLRGDRSIETLLAAAGKLCCRGVPVHLDRLNQLSAHKQRVLTDLPQYPFDHSIIHTQEARLNREFRLRPYANNELLGTRVIDWNPLEPTWRNVMRLDEMKWLQDHRVNNRIVLPGSGVIAMAIEAVRQLVKGKTVASYEIRDAIFHTPLVFPTETTVRETQMCLRPLSLVGDSDESTWYEYRLHLSKSDGEWEEIGRGSVCANLRHLAHELDTKLQSQVEQLRSFFASESIHCPQEVSPDLLYRSWKGMGLDLKPMVQLLDQIRFSNTGKALSTVQRPLLIEEATASDGKTSTQDFLVHATSLDALFQLIFASWTRGGTVVDQTMLPTRIDRVHISGTDLDNPNLGPFTAFSKSHEENVVNKRKRVCSVSALSEGAQQMQILLQGLEYTTISNSDPPQESHDQPSHLCYNMDWIVDLDMMDSQDILQYCSKGIVLYDEPVSWFRDIEFLALAFGFQAIEELRRADRQHIPSVDKYISWMRNLLDQGFSQLEPYSREEWEKKLANTDAMLAISSKMNSTNIGQTFVQVGRSLPRILSGDLDPLHVIYENEKQIRGFFMELNKTSPLWAIFSTYFQALLGKNPCMNILEIGAGTAATTELLLGLLNLDGRSENPHYQSYYLTDIGPSFLEKARMRFQEDELMKFGVLDIEKDPIMQGFEGEGYDLLVASHVLHATRTLTETLKHCRKLLKPGGKLILIELTAQHHLVPFIFGLLPGWWRSTEDYRQQSPCISETQWNEVLINSGFSGTDVVFQDYKSSECHVWSLMVSTAVSLEPTITPNPIIIIDKHSAFQQQMAKSIFEQLKLEEHLSPSYKIASLDDIETIVAANNSHTIFLNELESSVLRRIQPSQFEALERLLFLSGSFLWVSQGGGISMSPDAGMAQGLCRVSRQENPNLALSILNMEPITGDNLQLKAATIAKAFRHAAINFGHDTFEPEYLGLLHVSRLLQDQAGDAYIKARNMAVGGIQEFGKGSPLKLEIGTVGMLDSLHFIEDETTGDELGQNEVEVEVQAVGVNFMDCLAAMGRLKTDTVGLECAGIVRRVGKNCLEFNTGDRVAMCAIDCYKSIVRAKAELLLKIPDSMSFSEAAALPICFGTAYRCLYELAQVQPGDSVLIHSGSGGTGQAAIQLALLLNAEVFVTVGSDTKKKLLIDLYQIPEDHIYYSRDTSFAEYIKRITKGRGVDVVLNSLSGGSLAASWECIASFGHFFEIGKRDIELHSSLSMKPFGNNASFTGVDFLAIIQQRPTKAQKILEAVFEFATAGNIHSPFPLQVHSISEIEKTFRMLQSGNSSGKFVLELKRDAEVSTVLKPKLDYKLSQNATYVIAGGLGGIGRRIATWLVDRGAKNLLMLSRSGVKGHEKAQTLTTDLLKRGVRVETPICDISDPQSLRRVLRTFEDVLPPIKGCFQGAMVLQDSTLNEMSFEQWTAAVKPKVDGLWNLHNILPRDLEFFVLLSSFCGIYGNAGQGNYSAGNTYQDALARYRVALGENAVSLDLGPMLFEGYLAENPQVNERVKNLKVTRPISQDELSGLLDFYCDPSRQTLTEAQAQIVVGIELPARIRAAGSDVPMGLCQPIFRHLHQLEMFTRTTPAIRTSSLDYRDLISSAKSAEEANNIIAGALKKILSQILGLLEDNIDGNALIDSYGVDSLVTVELRNWLLKEIGADIAVFDIRGATIDNIAHAAAGKSSFRAQDRSNV
ncbi:uncharacterized protein LY89DRAFT_663132 [Mollisia scopiformis]|uniref:Uncharacterized protein n=1 Tax=Mollisia scopiformis TaxID=149040 RepID=A0A194XX74_MOLSC|nr:uncharacterized protein LY89DRAFT_663132 [Mollisia scopiformis]KUJ24392.1 hypothetical protein LY89DRAFT_663132 [Mollisia scopiformis]